MQRLARTGQRGFSLLEVMIAGAVLAVALLGLAALAVRALQDAADALDRRMAVMLLSDLEGRVSLTRPSGPGGASMFSADAEFDAWRRLVEDRLPDGRSGLCRSDRPVGPTAPGACAGAGTASWTATLQWRRPGGASADRHVHEWRR